MSKERLCVSVAVVHRSQWCMTPVTYRWISRARDFVPEGLAGWQGSAFVRSSPGGSGSGGPRLPFENSDLGDDYQGRGPPSAVSTVSSVCPLALFRMQTES